MQSASAVFAGTFLLIALLLPAVVVSGDAGGEGASSPGLAELLGSDDSRNFEQALEPRRFVFPRDHGPHEGFRNEWWYFTGNLETETRRRFGFELTIFRFQLTRAIDTSPSAWRTNQVYIAHFALTDAERGRFHTAERSSRGAAGLAGATVDPLRIWIDDWEISSRDTDTELMFYNLRQRDGSRDVHSAGTWIDADGRSTHLGADDVRIAVTDTWENPEGAVYPAGWQLSAPKLGLELEVAPVMGNQELVTLVRYWEGAVDVRGAGKTGP